MNKFPPVSPKIPHMIHGGDYNPDQWRNYPGIVDEDVRLMKLAGINEASLAIFAWAALEPQEGVFDFSWLDEAMDKLYQGGIYTILATPSGSRPAWMDEKYPEVRRVEANRMRNLHGFRHNHCNTSPAFKEKVAIMNTRLAERYKDHPGLIMWHISNEYGGQCHCEYCQAAFRGWLKEKYGDIDTLNAAWWTYFWSHEYASFDQIESPAPNGENFIHGLNLDWKRFTTWKTVEFMRHECQPLRQITPDIPVTTNMMGTYTGLDYRRFAGLLDRVSWDNYPAWHNDRQALWETASDIGFVQDINRTLLGGKPFLLMESTPSIVNWRDVNKLKRPGMHLLSSLQAVAHGSDSVQYFQWRKGRGASEKLHGAVVDHVGHENTRVFAEVRQVGQALSKLDAVVGTSVEPEVAVLYDWENRWAIDDLQGLTRASSTMQPLSSYVSGSNIGDEDEDFRKYEQTCKLHYRAFYKRGIPADIIGQDDDFSKYKLIVAPMLYMLRPGVAERLKRFVDSGGTLVTTYLTGYVDDTDLCFLGGFPGDGLRELTGIWAEEIDSLYPSDENRVVFSDQNSLNVKGSFKAHTYCELIHAESAQVLAAYGEDFYAGRPALTVNEYGGGKAYHIAVRTDFDMLDKFYGAVISQTGIKKALETDLPEGVSVQIRGDGESDYLFVMNFSPNDAGVPLGTDEYTDLLTGGTGSGAYVMQPYGVAVLKRAAQFRSTGVNESKTNG